MKTEADLRQYLSTAGGNLTEAFRLACNEHCHMDQTLDMKRVQLVKLIEAEKNSTPSEGV